MSTTEPHPVRTPRRRTGVGALAALAIGVGGAVIGLLPWIVSGLRLPVQNLWSEEIVDPGAMPIALLPFSQYAVSLLAAVIVLGGAFAGLAARLLRRRMARFGSLLVVLGLLVVQVVALVQTTGATSGGLRMDGGDGSRTGAGISEAQVYLVAFVAGTVAAILVAAAVALLVARAPAGVAVVAAALAIALLGSWLAAFVAPVGGSGVDEVGRAILAALRWVPPVALGLAIAATGLRGAGRILGAILAVLVLWVATAAVTAVSSALGSRALLRYPLELADYAGQVLVAALGPASRVLPELAVLVVVAAVGAVVVRRRARR